MWALHAHSSILNDMRRFGVFFLKDVSRCGYSCSQDRGMVYHDPTYTVIHRFGVFSAKNKKERRLSVSCFHLTMELLT
jgi:hypothetical protein